MTKQEIQDLQFFENLPNKYWALLDDSESAYYTELNEKATQIIRAKIALRKAN